MRQGASLRKFTQPTSSRSAVQRVREGIERERAQQVAAQSALDFAETLGGTLHPGEVGGSGHFLEFAHNVRIADQSFRARLQEHQVFEQRVGGAEKVVDFCTAFGAGTVALGSLEQLSMIAAAKRGFQHDERVAASGNVAFDVEG